MKRVITDIINNYNSIATMDEKGGIKIIKSDTLNCCTFGEYKRVYMDLVHSTDKLMLNNILDLNRLLNSKKNTVIVKLYDKSIKDYSLCQFETIKTQKGVILTWRDADEIVGDFIESSRLLSVVYYKALKLNLDNGTYKEVTIGGDGNQYDNLTNWVKNFVLKGNVHLEDAKQLLEFTDLENMKKFFVGGKLSKKVIRYRRLANDGTFRWVILEVIPSKEYTENNRVVMLYVRDIHDDYVAQLSENRRMLYLMTHNEYGIGNNIAFNDKITNSHTSENIGMVYISLGDIGDKRIKREKTQAHIDDILEVFQPQQCYMIDNQEIVIIVENESKNSFECKVAQLDLDCETVSYWNTDKHQTLADMFTHIETLANIE